MIKHRNFHPEICKLLDELDGLRDSSSVLAGDFMRSDEDRAYSRATVDTYAYCMMRIRDLNIPAVANLEPELEEAEKMITALRYDRNFWRDEHGKGGNQ